MSCTPLLKPRAPNGETRWAASPAKITGPWMKRLQPPALEGVDADPLELERPVLAEHRLQPRADALGLALLDRVGVPAELQVDAPDVVGLLVQQGGLAGVERRVEPEPALGRDSRPAS